MLCMDHIGRLAIYNIEKTLVVAGMHLAGIPLYEFNLWLFACQYLFNPRIQGLTFLTH